MAAWLPIETAPKDDTRFLGVNAKDHLYWPYVFHYGWERDGKPVWSMADEYFTDSLTHWMPLPEAPQLETNSTIPKPTSST